MLNIRLTAVISTIIAFSACQPDKTPIDDDNKTPFVETTSTVDAQFFLSSMDQAIQAMTMKAIAKTVSGIGDFDLYRGAYINTTTSVDCDEEGTENVTVVYEDNSTPIEGGLDQTEFMRISHAADGGCKTEVGGSYSVYTGSITSDIEWGTLENDLWQEFVSDTTWQGSFEIQDQYDNSNWKIEIDDFKAIVSRTELELSSEIGLNLTIDGTVTYQDIMGDTKTAAIVVSNEQPIPLVVSWSTATVSNTQVYIDPEVSQRFANGSSYTIDINNGDQVVLVSTAPEGNSYTVNELSL